MCFIVLLLHIFTALFAKTKVRRIEAPIQQWLEVCHNLTNCKVDYSYLLTEVGTGIPPGRLAPTSGGMGGGLQRSQLPWLGVSDYDSTVLDYDQGTSALFLCFLGCSCLHQWGSL